tara:strand:- start:12005 stop:12649 length:645 start_codon:yes stop_codon:yes gene_type:complete
MLRVTGFFRAKAVLRSLTAIGLNKKLHIDRQSICASSRAYWSRKSIRTQLATGIETNRAALRALNLPNQARRHSAGGRPIIHDACLMAAFSPAKFAKGVVVELPYPTDDTRYITRAAIAGLEHVYREGFSFSKAEVLLMDLRQRGEYTNDLFAETQPAASERVMGVLDAINAKWGRDTLRPGRVPTTPDWGMRRDMMSRSFTTRIDQLWLVRCK